MARLENYQHDETVIEGCKAGLTAKQIGDHAGISASQVWTICNRLGIEPLRMRRRVVDLPNVHRADSAQAFPGLTPLRYSLIMADPPWTFTLRSAKGEKKAAQAHYDCMTISEIMMLPVNHLAAPDCVLWLWATNPMLPQAFEVMRSWGFKFKTAGHWVKRTPHGKLAFGTGYVLRSAGEPFLIGTIGRPKTSKSVRSVIEGPVREHSRKPDEAYAAAEALVDGPKADLFSRQARSGWDAWGAEAGRFDVR